MISQRKTRSDKGIRKNADQEWVTFINCFRNMPLAQMNQAIGYLQGIVDRIEDEEDDQDDQRTGQ